MFKWLGDMIIGRSKDDRWKLRVPRGWCVEFVCGTLTQRTIIDEETTLFDHYITGYASSEQWASGCGVFDVENMPYRIAEYREFTSAKTVKVVLSNW